MSASPVVLIILVLVVLVAIGAVVAVVLVSSNKKKRAKLQQRGPQRPGVGPGPQGPPHQHQSPQQGHPQQPGFGPGPGMPPQQQYQSRPHPDWQESAPARDQGQGDAQRPGEPR